MQTSPRYKSHDYEFGTLIESYRKKAKLTQPALGKLIGVSKRAVINWEAGSSYPQLTHLRRLLEIFLEKDCFTSSEELVEAEFIWEKATKDKNDAKDAFNADWFSGLLQDRAGSPHPLILHQPLHLQDWSEAVDKRVLYGREREQAELENWLVGDRLQLVSLFGMGGIGKTSLAISLAHQVVPHFEYVIFRTMRNAPPLDELLDGLLRFFLQGNLTLLPALQSEKMALVMNYLRRHRCLVVLDNFESIMQARLGAGEYSEGYTDYAEFIRRVCEFTHKSCVLLTGREKPKLLGFYEEKKGPVRSLALKGLDKKSCQAVLKSVNIHSAEDYGQTLMERYGGNPLALMLIAEPIRRMFGGHTGAFLASPGSRSGGIRYVLDQHFERLSEVELDILYWLTLSREPLDLAAIQRRSVLRAGAVAFSDGLTALLSRFLVERNEDEDGSGFTLQSVIGEYVTERFTSQIFEEIMGSETESDLTLLCRYPLLQTGSRSFIRQAQLRVLVDPLLGQLGLALKSPESITRHVSGLLERLRALPLDRQAYAGGNLLNLLVRQGKDLEGLDFSNLSLWQAHLAGKELISLDMSGSDLSGATFTQADISAYSMALSPDGQTVAVGCMDGSVRAWEVGQTFGRQLFERRDHLNLVLALVFNREGTLLASCGHDGTVRLWEPQSGLNLAVFACSDDSLRSLVLSPDSKILVCGGTDGRLYFWKVSSGRLLGSFDAEQGWIMTIALSPDGQQLVTGGYGGTVKFWDFPAVIQALTEGHDSLGPVTVWGDHDQWIYSLAFSPDGKWLACGSGGQTISIWQTDTEMCRWTLQCTSGVLRLAFSPDGKTLACVSHDGTINLWTNLNPVTFRSLPSNYGAVMALAFNPNGETFVSCGGEISHIQLWSLKTLEELDVLVGYSIRIYLLTISPDNKWLAAGGLDNQIFLWNLTDPLQTRPFVFKVQQGIIYSLTFSPDSKIIATGGSEKIIQLWNVETRKCWRTLTGCEGVVSKLTFSHDGRMLLSGDGGGNLRGWSVITGEQLFCHKAFTGVARAIIFSPDGTTIATGSEEKVIRFWEIDEDNATIKPKAAWSTESELIMALTYNFDGSILLSADANGIIETWDTQTGQRLARFKGHRGFIWRLEYNSATKRLFSAGEDGSIKIWEIGERGNLILLTVLEQTSKALAVVSNRQGSRLYSVGNGGDVNLWNLEDAEKEGKKSATILSLPLPYEQLNITGAAGLTKAQRLNLLNLGAIENPDK